MFTNKTLLITGGTGSFGNAILRRFLMTDIKEIRVFSRDELKEELTQHPEMFTEDIKYIMKKFAKLIKPITKINKVLND